MPTATQAPTDQATTSADPNQAGQSDVAPGDVEVFSIKTDENVGSFLLGANLEAWQRGVKAMRENDDTSKFAEAVTALLRAANNNPAPGARIEIEIMPSTDSDAIVDTLQQAMGLPVEDGTYNRKSRTTKSPTASAAKSGAGANGATKKGKAKGTPRECTCGCGGTTAGGFFLPGHDARFKGQRLREIDEGGSTGEAALARLKEFPNLYDYDQAAQRLGSGPAKEAAKNARLAELKAQKAAEKANTPNGADGATDGDESGGEESAEE